MMITIRSPKPIDIPPTAKHIAFMLTGACTRGTEDYSGEVCLTPRHNNKYNCFKMWNLSIIKDLQKMVVLFRLAT